jgi:DNA polymerase V
VHIFSSNFALYGEMSARVMATLAQFTSEMEIYSIDEAFLELGESGTLNAEADHIRSVVNQWTGIPVSIGIAPTKTLAKAANRHAKKKCTEKGFFILKEEEIPLLLKGMPVEDVWGVGSRLKERLAAKGIRTAWEYACMDDAWVKKNLSVVGLRTVWELRGIPCLSLEEAPEPKKSILCSRSFGVEVTTEEALGEALSNYVASAAERLRDQSSLASFLEVFAHTSRFKTDAYYSNRAHVTLPIPTDFTPSLMHYAKEGLKKIYREGFAYKKVGVMLGGIVSNEALQLDLFTDCKQTDVKKRSLMELMDKANAKYGRNTLKMASQGISQEWKSRRSKCTAHFTTSWDELLEIKI